MIIPSKSIVEVISKKPASGTWIKVIRGTIISRRTACLNQDRSAAWPALSKKNYDADPVIGHIKSSPHLRRNYLRGIEADKINALLAGVGYNFRLLLRCLRIFYPWLFAQFSSWLNTIICTPVPLYPCTRCKDGFSSLAKLPHWLSDIKNNGFLTGNYCSFKQ